jgi:hypothetical protein
VKLEVLPELDVDADDAGPLPKGEDVVVATAELELELVEDEEVVIVEVELELVLVLLVVVEVLRLLDEVEDTTPKLYAVPARAPAVVLTQFDEAGAG